MDLERAKLLPDGVMKGLQQQIMCRNKSDTYRSYSAVRIDELRAGCQHKMKSRRRRKKKKKKK